MPADLPVGTRGTFHCKHNSIPDEYDGQACAIIDHDEVWDYKVRFDDGKECMALRTNFKPL